MFKILVLEDDRELNKTVCSYLNQNGYEAVVCLAAGEAYDAMYGGTLFDMIISDIMMPGVDGFEFAQTIREQDRDIPILFMTARDDFSATPRGSKAGIDDYMTKLRNKFSKVDDFEIVAVHGLGYKAVLKLSSRRKKLI